MTAVYSLIAFTRRAIIMIKKKMAAPLEIQTSPKCIYFSKRAKAFVQGINF
jgi:hypothetical protein